MNVPKLRFKEFNDEYKSIKLKDVSEIYDGTHETPNYVEKGVKFVSVENISNLLDTTKFIPESDYNKYKIKPKYNDVFMTRIGDIGTSSIYKSDEELAYYVSLALLRTKDNHILIPDYLNQYIKNNSFQKELYNRTIHVAFPKKINTGEIGECSINLCSDKEQLKVSNFLSLLDKKIELQSKKIEDLKLFKKGLLIKEFNNKKCSNKLKECFDFGKAGGTPKSTNKEYYNGYIPFLSISDMTTQGKYIYYTNKSITEAGLNNSTAWLVPKNSIIISMYASYGLVSINKIDLTTSQAMFNMVINKNYVVEYIYYYLYYLYISNFYNSIVSTGTQSNLNAEQIKLLDMYIPCYNEQKRIYEQFSKIDFKINLEQKKINELLYLKKGLMQNMFV